MSELAREALVCLVILIIIGLFAYAIDPSVGDKDWFRKWVNDDDD